MLHLQAEVRPRCGRVVGFGAGKENPHGVRAVTRGQRCAVALWFTLDPSHEEKVGLIALHYAEMEPEEFNDTLLLFYYYYFIIIMIIKFIFIQPS